MAKINIETQKPEFKHAGFKCGCLYQRKLDGETIVYFCCSVETKLLLINLKTGLPYSNYDCNKELKAFPFGSLSKFELVRNTTEVILKNEIIKYSSVGNVEITIG